MTEYSLRFEDRKSYLFAYIEGEDSFDASLEYWKRIAKLNYSRVLVHENLTGNITDSEIYWIVSKFAETGFMGIEIGLFDEHISDKDLNELGQLVAQNRGAMVKLFSTLQAAEEWAINTPTN